jgi:hypothetical protein
VRAIRESNQGYLLIEATANSVSRFDVAGNGLTTIHAGGFIVQDGAESDFRSTTDATTATAAAVRTAGGIAVAKKVHVGEGITTDTGGVVSAAHG